MLTWLQLWWQLVTPIFFVGLLSVMPTVRTLGHVLGGGPIREWLLNHCFLPLLPDRLAAESVAWWMHATYVQEITVALVIALNLNVLLLPLLWAQGHAHIAFRAWLARRSLADRRRLIRS